MLSHLSIKQLKRLEPRHLTNDSDSINNFLDGNPLKGTVETLQISVPALFARMKEASIIETEIFWNSNL